MDKRQILARVLLAPAFALWLLGLMPARAGETEAAAFSAESLRGDVEKLAGEFSLRNHAHPDVLAQVAVYIGDRFRKAGARVEIDAFQADGATYRNVIARFGPETGRAIVIGAHYDAAESTPGADDNASGVAGILALADALRASPPEVPVELVAWCLEEPPFFGSEEMGSRRHARALKAAGQPPRLVVSLEMIGYFSDRPGSQRYPDKSLTRKYPDKGNFIAVVGNPASAGDVERVKDAMAAAGTIPVEGLAAPESLPGIGLSDHASYWKEGWPAVMVTDTAFHRNPNYHEAGDKPGTLDYRRMAGVVQALLKAVGRLGKDAP